MDGWTDELTDRQKDIQAEAPPPFPKMLKIFLSVFTWPNGGTDCVTDGQADRGMDMRTYRQRAPSFPKKGA